MKKQFGIKLKKGYDLTAKSLRLYGFKIKKNFETFEPQHLFKVRDKQNIYKRSLKWLNIN